MKHVWMVLAFQLLSFQASASVVETLASKAKEEVIGAITGESVGALKSIESLENYNQVRVMKQTNSVRVKWEDGGDYSLGLYFPSKGKVHISDFGELWLPSGYVAVTFTDKEGKVHPYRYTNIPRTDQTIVLSAMPSISDKQRKSRKIPLTVKTYPEGAEVKIMNIGPKYKPGMVLREGRYDIVVKMPGYRTYRKMHKLEWNEPEFHIVLEPRA